MSRDLVDTVLKVIHGTSLLKTIDTGFYWYDKSNMDRPKIQENLYQ